MKPFELEIITPGNTIFKGMVSSLIIPAYEGYMGIMAGHASFIGSLGNGKISFNITENTSSLKNEKELSPKTNQDDIASEKRFDDSTGTYFVKDGFIEVISHPFSQPDRLGLAGMTKVTILAENISSDSQITLGKTA